MSFMGTLAKVALGVAAAKGIGHVVGRATQSTSTNATGSQPGQGDPLAPFPAESAKRAEGSAACLNNSPRRQVAPVPVQRRRAPSGGLDALIRGLAGAASGTATGTIEQDSRRRLVCRSAQPILSRSA